MSPKSAELSEKMPQLVKRNHTFGDNFTSLVIPQMYIISNGGDGNSEAIEQILGKNWEKLAEFGQIWYTTFQILNYHNSLSTFRFFYFDL